MLSTTVIWAVVSGLAIAEAASLSRPLDSSTSCGECWEEHIVSSVITISSISRSVCLPASAEKEARAVATEVRDARVGLLEPEVAWAVFWAYVAGTHKVTEEWDRKGLPDRTADCGDIVAGTVTTGDGGALALLSLSFTSLWEPLLAFAFSLSLSVTVTGMQGRAESSG